MSEELGRADAQIDDVLAGRGGYATDPTVLWLAAGARPAPPAGLMARIDAQVTTGTRGGGARSDQPGLFLILVAAVLALAFLIQGVGNLVAGEWLADNLGEPYAPHPFREGGLALIAIAVCAAAATGSRRWSTASVLTCSPLAVGFGLHGFTEIGVFGAGVALHMSQGVLGLLLILAWWLDRRDTSRPTHEGEGRKAGMTWES